MMVLQLAVVVALLVAATGEEISADTFRSQVLKSDNVWLIYFKGADCSSCAEFDATWTELAASLNRVSTGELTIGSAEANEIASSHGVQSDSLPSLKLFRSFTDAPATVMEGTPMSVKQLRKAMKKNLKGLEKNADGKFVKPPDADDSTKFGAKDINFLVQSQLGAPHERVMGDELRDALITEGVKSTRVHLLHRIQERWEKNGGGPPFHVDFWCYLPWLIRLHADKSSKSKWYVFLDPETKLNLPTLKKVLATRDYRKNHFFGHQLVDSKASIARSFDTSTAYPLKKAGFVVSGALFEALMKSIEDEPIPTEQNIDAVFQMVQFIRGRLKV
jgi:hypothetical protein